VYWDDDHLSNFGVQLVLPRITSVLEQALTEVAALAVSIDSGSLLGFTPDPVSVADAVMVPEGYRVPVSCMPPMQAGSWAGWVWS
jgi:hypothetical protein